VHPAALEFLADMAQILDHAFLGGASIGTVGHGSVDHVQIVIQAGA
jgi:hypothetical protein